MFNWIRSREAETIQKIFNTSNADFRQIELKDLRDDRPCLVCTNLICLLRSCGVTDIQNAMKISPPRQVYSCRRRWIRSGDSSPLLQVIQMVNATYRSIQAENEIKSTICSEMQ
jgi:hypothetical protein